VWFTVSNEGTFIIKIMSITSIWYSNIQVTSSSETRGHVDIQAGSNIVPKDIAILMKVRYCCLSME
jgi:hypothetical protein